MVLFLAINTSGLTLIPSRTIALRAEFGSASPTSIMLPALVATACSTLVAVVMAKLLAPRFPTTKDVPVDDDEAAP